MLRMFIIVVLLGATWAATEAVEYWKSPVQPQTTEVVKDSPAYAPRVRVGLPAELWPGGSRPAPKAESADEAVMPERRAAVQTGSAQREDLLKTAALSPPPGGGNEPEQTATDAAEAAPLPDEKKLAAAIQEQLKALGYYKGKIDNIWGRGSRAAMRSYNKERKTNLALRPAMEVYKALRAANDAAQDAGSRSSKRSEAEPAVQLNASIAAADFAGVSSYLPPWMTEGAPAGQNVAELEEAAAGNPATAVQSLASRQPASRQEASMRREAPKRGSLSAELRGAGFAWPGQ